MKTVSGSTQTESKPFDPHSLNLEQKEAALRDAADFLRNLGQVLRQNPELLKEVFSKESSGQPTPSSEKSTEKVQ